MSGSLIPNAKQQFLDSNGKPLAGGKVYYYIPSTTTFKNTYQDIALTILNTNPIILDSAGECIAWGAGAFRQVVTDVNGNLIWDQPTLSFNNDAANVIYTPPFTNGVPETVSAKLSESVSVKDFGAKGDGVTDDTVAIQNALNAIGVIGGILYINSGIYKITSTLNLLGVSNVTICGSGIGASIIDGSGVTGNILNLGYSSSPPITATLNNIAIEQLSIKGSGTSATNHLVYFGGINNITFNFVEFYNGYNEGVYCEGGGVGLTVQNCNFHDCFKGSISNGLNTNTLNYSNILITNNSFVRMATGIFILGKNVIITNNTFIDIKNTGIAVGESNTNATASISGCVISNNTFYRLGKLTTSGYSFVASKGIQVNGTIQAYTDKTQDSGVIVSSNTFKDTWLDTGCSVVCIYLNSNAKVEGNYAANIINAGTQYSTFIVANFSTVSGGVNAYPITIWLDNNVCELTDNGINFTYGLSVTSVQNTYLFCSGNRIYGDSSTGIGAFFSQTGNGYLPYVSLDGDIFSPTNYLYDLTSGAEPGLGVTPNPIFGTNSTTFYTGSSRDLFPSYHEIGGSTTPSVNRGNYFKVTNATATSISDFINPTSGAGVEITLWFSDANTTVLNNSNIVLNGSTNFVSSQGASLTLVKPNIISSAWYEKCRSKP